MRCDMMRCDVMSRDLMCCDAMPCDVMSCHVLRRCAIGHERRGDQRKGEEERRGGGGDEERRPCEPCQSKIADSIKVFCRFLTTDRRVVAKNTSCMCFMSLCCQTAIC